MMQIKPEEVSKLIKEQIKNYENKITQNDTGTILMIGDGIARVSGLEKCMANELVRFSNGEYGMALNLEENSVAIVMLGNDEGIREGDTVERTGKVVSVPVGEALIGRVVNALGQPVDGKGDIEAKEYRPIERNAPAFRVDFSALQQNLLGDKWYRCSPAGPRCEHVFRELYESAAYLDPAFLRLKVLELLMLLSSIPRGAGTDAYCSARQAELIRHIRDHLLTDREGYTSLSRLAAEHEMSVSHLQKLFKQIYGVPVYHYIKEYRLEQAAVELVRSARPVTEIAQDAGYDNASKFSACFKERYGVTPSQYRTDAKAKQSIGTKTE